MQSFTGTARRLEKIHDSENLTVFRDFAHAPSKVKATVDAVREQFPDHDFNAVLELHTFSSLQPNFLPGYKGTLDAADSALIFLDPHVFELKKMHMPNFKNLKEMLGKVELSDKADELFCLIEKNLMKSKKKVLLLMSSGNYDGIDLPSFAPTLI